VTSRPLQPHATHHARVECFCRIYIYTERHGDAPPAFPKDLSKLRAADESAAPSEEVATMATALEAHEVDSVENAARDWRVEKFVDLGFTLPQAEVLAETRDHAGFFIYWGDVDELLRRGWSHNAAFDVLA
jgi:hypothetical protein